MKCTIGKQEVSFLSEKMFGLFFEDINYAADGGLYAEMIENRQFAFRKAWPGSVWKTYDTEWIPGYGWTVYPENADAVMSFREGDALSVNNPHYMVFDVKNEGAGFVNKAYDGICLKAGAEYRVTLGLRTGDYCGKITVSVLDPDRLTVAATEQITVAASGEWKLYTMTLRAEHAVRNGCFLVQQETGCVAYGVISMIPQDAVAGVFRRDLYEMLAALKPGFLRFPGGCIVEGANLGNRYRWKDTVGPVWDRKWNWNRWAVHDVTMGQGEACYYPVYNQSYGIGFYEYFLLCELLECKPLPVLNVGLACQFQSDELVATDSPEFGEYLQDALDLIEFANGDLTTKWGALRGEMGHPEPFGLEYVGIGNEQWETDKVDFFARYTAFEKTIHERYPEIRLLGSAGPDVTTERYTAAWEFYRRNAQSNAGRTVHGKPVEAFTSAVDEHYYMPPAWFYEHTHMYDEYPREIPVFAGEYAAHCDKKQNSLEAALAEAAFMCGLERNGDVIRFASVAPLFARKGYVQWIPDFIWFDGEHVSGTPGYYVQQLFGAYTGSRSVSFTLEGATDEIYSAVSRDAEHYYLKIIHTGRSAMTLDTISLHGEERNCADCVVMQMSGADPDDVNVLGEEDRIALRRLDHGERVVIPPLSCTVIFF